MADDDATTPAAAQATQAGSDQNLKKTENALGPYDSNDVGGSAAKEKEDVDNSSSSSEDPGAKTKTRPDGKKELDENDCYNVLGYSWYDQSRPHPDRQYLTVVSGPAGRSGWSSRVYSPFRCR